MPPTEPILCIMPGEGRFYSLGPMTSYFLADGDECADRYSVSEWWLEPHTPGPGVHSHEANEELFYVIEGTMTFQAGDQVVEAPRGAFIRVPAGVPHDFMNNSDQRAGVLNVFVPGGFEALMPGFVEWFRKSQETV